MVKCGGLRILGKLVYVCWFRSGHVGRFEKEVGWVVGMQVGSKEGCCLFANGEMRRQDGERWRAAYSREIGICLLVQKWACG